MEMMLWNIVLSIVVAVMGFFLKGKIERVGPPRHLCSTELVKKSPATMLLALR